MGNQIVLNHNKIFRSLVGLTHHEKIFGTITMGYSYLKFRKKVMGKNIPVQWNSSNNWIRELVLSES